MRKIILSTFLVIFCCSGFSALAAESVLSNADIDQLLQSYDEPGYKFVEKMDETMWKVQFYRPGWQFGWEVVITSTSDKPENSFVVIGTTVTATEQITGKFLLQLLDENGYDTNPGNYSIFIDEGTYIVQYSVKLPQAMLNKDFLMEGIGFVAGYTNSRINFLEKMLKEQAE